MPADGAAVAEGGTTTLAPLRGWCDKCRHPLYSTATETPVVPAVIPARGLIIGEKMEEWLFFRPTTPRLYFSATFAQVFLRQ